MGAVVMYYHRQLDKMADLDDLLDIVGLRRELFISALVFLTYSLCSLKFPGTKATFPLNQIFTDVLVIPFRKLFFLNLKDYSCSSLDFD